MENQKEIKHILRVNHAGEIGAQQIYEGMLKVLGNDPNLMQMSNQEQKHLKEFTQLMIKNKVRPTIFQPIWYILSYGMGFTTALMGKKAAHACTIAVEEVIVDHYQHQINSLQNSHHNKSLIDTIEKFKNEEDDHRKIAEQAGGREANGFKILEKIVKNITRTAIRISTKI